jgi:hypothetical protein
MGYFKKMFDQDWEALLTKANLAQSPYDFDREDYEHQIQELRSQLK